MEKIAKTAMEPGNATPAELIPARRKRRLAWLLQRPRQPWSHFSLGRSQRAVSPRGNGPQYRAKTPKTVSDFEAIALAEIKRSVKNRRWASDSGLDTGKASGWPASRHAFFVALRAAAAALASALFIDDGIPV